jgi:hypothetical protein
MRDAKDIGTRALIVALLAHVAVVVGVSVMPMVRLSHAPAPADGTVAIELVDETGSLANAAARERPERTAEPDRANELVDRPTTRTPIEGEAAKITRPTAGSREITEPHPRDRDDAPVPTVDLVRHDVPGALGLELGAANRFVGPEGPVARIDPGTDRTRPLEPRTTEESKVAVEASLRAQARNRERELGLGPEGPVLAALGEAASASTAPVHGKAVFVAIADGTGMIVGIDVVDCDGARDGWARAAAMARTALKGKKLRLPSNATRAEMRIEVTSEWKLPSGHDPGVDVSLFGLPVSKGEGKQSTKVTVLDPIPKLKSEVIEIAPGQKISIPSIEITVVAVHGDPVDIGARPRRIVHTRLIDSKVL